MRKLDFDPAKHGFHFTNTFINHVIGQITTSGLCGGMALAAARYHQHGLAAPTHVPADFPDGSPAGVPPEGSPLQAYIYGCQMESFGPLGLLSALNWVTAADRNQQFDWSVGEFDNIRRNIDAGHPVVIGLRQAQGGPVGHQILAYGYDENGLKIFVYDSNHPDEEHVLCIDQAQRRLVYDGSAPEWSSVFVTGCSMDGPPPPYTDLGLLSGITVSTTDTVPAGGQASIDVTVQNFGMRDAHVSELFVWTRGPAGENVDGLFGGGDNDPSPIPPGGQRSLRRTCENFGSTPGTYTVGVSYLSQQGRWVDIPATVGGTRDQVTFRVAGAAAPSSPAWRSLGGVLNSPPAVAVNNDGRLEVFGRGTDNRIWHLFQRSTANPDDIGGWDLLPGDQTFSGTPTAVRNHWGKLEVFARGRDGGMYHRWQNSPNTQNSGDWGPWQALGNQLAFDPSAVCNHDDRLEVFAVQDDGFVHHIYQRWFDPFGAPWSGWEALGSRAFTGRVAVERDGGGCLFAIARARADSSIWWIRQNSPGGNWSDWQPTGGVGGDPSVARNADGRLEAFLRGTDGRVWHMWQGAPGSGFGGWDLLHDAGSVRPVLDADLRPTAWTQADASIGVVAVQTDQQAAVTVRTNTDPWWSDYELVGSEISSEVAAASGNGSSGLFALGPARDLRVLIRHA